MAAGPIGPPKPGPRGEPIQKSHPLIQTTPPMPRIDDENVPGLDRGSMALEQQREASGNLSDESSEAPVKNSKPFKNMRSY